MEMPPAHVVTAEQFTAAEERHEQERAAAKQVKKVCKDEEALKVSMDQMREVRVSNSICFLGNFVEVNDPCLLGPGYRPAMSACY